MQPSRRGWRQHGVRSRPGGPERAETDVPTPIEETLPAPEHGAAPGDWVAENVAELEEMNSDTWETVEVASAASLHLEFAFAAQT